MRKTASKRRSGSRSAAGRIGLPPDWIELLSLLNRYRVRHLIVGAHAVMVHTEPRATEDFDIYVDPAATARLLKALAAFMGPNAAAQAIGMYHARHVLMLGHKPWQVDLLNAVDGLPSFDAAWRRRVPLTYGGVPTAVPALPDMIRAKRAVVAKARPGAKGVQDRADLLRLQDEQRRRRRKQRV